MTQFIFCELRREYPTLSPIPSFHRIYCTLEASQKIYVEQGPCIESNVTVFPPMLYGYALPSWPPYSQISLTALSINLLFLGALNPVIVLVPKKAKAIQLKDYQPVALTSVVIKDFEHLGLTYRYSKECTGHLRDPFQFAYQNNRSIEGTVAFSLHHSLKHLENSGSCVRIPFLHFSSAFNTIVLHKLFDKLLRLNVHLSVCYWILDFLLESLQVVRINNGYTGPTVLNTGAPHGCVLSPTFC